MPPNLRKWLIEHPKLVRFLTKMTPFFRGQVRLKNFTISLPDSFLMPVIRSTIAQTPKLKLELQLEAGTALARGERSMSKNC